MLALASIEMDELQELRNHLAGGAFHVTVSRAQLRAADAAWRNGPPALDARAYLEAVLAARGDRARVHPGLVAVEHAGEPAAAPQPVVLNRRAAEPFGGRLFAGDAAACEACGRVFRLRQHARAGNVLCRACRDDERAERRLGPREDFEWCVGCLVFGSPVDRATGQPRGMGRAKWGALYAPGHDACRKRADAYLKAGGTIETTRAGQRIVLRR